MTRSVPTTMEALVKEGRTVARRPVPIPAATAPGSVLVRVLVAGVCRTDLYVAEGRIPAADPLILGHELSGEVVTCAPDVRDLGPGDRVTADPRLPCGRCDGCRGGEPCGSPGFLGVTAHGAFAEYVVLPAAVLHRLPPDLDPRRGAFVEPVAAALAILDAGLDPASRGVVHGHSRFAVLMQRVLALAGFDRVTLLDPGAAPPSAVDFAVETSATGAALRQLVEVLRPGGTLVLKSRTPDPVPVPFGEIVTKGLVLRGVHYGRFEDAARHLASGALEVDDLLADPEPLARHAEVFAAARAGEARKLLFSLG